MSIKMRVTAAVLAASTLGGVLWFTHRADAGTTPSYRLGKVERGSVKSTVSATGTLSAVRPCRSARRCPARSPRSTSTSTTHVKKGQLLARIDPIAAASRRCRTRRPSSRRRRRSCTQTQLDYERNKQLHDAADRHRRRVQRRAVELRAGAGQPEVRADQRSSARSRTSRTRTSTRRSTASSSSATWTSARPSPRASRRRSCSSSPTTCRAMQILASVDESDIGKIKEGQPVHVHRAVVPRPHVHRHGRAGAPAARRR